MDIAFFFQGLQMGTDTISNILKEFWPDFKRKFMHK